QFVKLPTAQKRTNRCESFVKVRFGFVNGFMFHCPKLENRECNSVQSRACLLEKRGTPGGQAHSNTHTDTDRQHKRSSQEYADDVECPLAMGLRPSTDQGPSLLTFQ